MEELEGLWLDQPCAVRMERQQRLHYKQHKVHKPYKKALDSSARMQLSMEVTVMIPTSFTILEIC